MALFLKDTTAQIYLNPPYGGENLEVTHPWGKRLYSYSKAIAFLTEMWLTL